LICVSSTISTISLISVISEFSLFLAWWPNTFG
jgi:hypothetical protein